MKSDILFNYYINSGKTQRELRELIVSSKTGEHPHLITIGGWIRGNNIGGEFLESVKDLVKGE